MRADSSEREKAAKCEDPNEAHARASAIGVPSGVPRLNVLCAPFAVDSFRQIDLHQGLKRDVLFVGERLDLFK